MNCQSIILKCQKDILNCQRNFLKSATVKKKMNDCKEHDGLPIGIAKFDIKKGDTIFLDMIKRNDQFAMSDE